MLYIQNYSYYSSSFRSYIFNNFIEPSWFDSKVLQVLQTIAYGNVKRSTSKSGKKVVPSVFNTQVVILGLSVLCCIHSGLLHCTQKYKLAIDW